MLAKENLLLRVPNHISALINFLLLLIEAFLVVDFTFITLLLFFTRASVILSAVLWFIVGGRQASGGPITDGHLVVIVDYLGTGWLKEGACAGLSMCWLLVVELSWDVLTLNRIVLVLIERNKFTWWEALHDHRLWQHKSINFFF